eukprot:jgi/Mesvir1/24272/Mv10972-RA.1
MVSSVDLTAVDDRSHGVRTVVQDPLPGWAFRYIPAASERSSEINVRPDIPTACQPEIHTSCPFNVVPSFATLLATWLATWRFSYIIRALGAVDLNATFAQLWGADVSLNGNSVNDNATLFREVGQLHQDFLPDAVIVLGGGQSGAKKLPVWVERRLDAAIEEHGRPPYPPIVVLGGGTPHRAPYTNDWGFVVHEATSCAEYLLQRGVEPHRVFKEWGSYDTIANAYFALVWHAAPAGWRNLLVITSAFHMERSELIFRWVFGLQGVDQMAGADRGFQLAFRAVSDDGIDPAVINARRVREKQQVEDLKLKMAEIKTLAQFHRWFHASHKAYNVEHQGQFGAASATDIPNIALDSY